MSECIEHEDSINEHDDFEEAFDYSSDDNDMNEPFSSNNGENDNRPGDDPPSYPSDVFQDNDKRVASAPVASDTSESSADSYASPVPTVIQRIPESKDSVLSDVTGMTALDRMAAMSSQSKQRPRVNATTKKNHHVVATRIKTYFEDGTYTERLQFPDGTETTATHTGTGISEAPTAEHSSVIDPPQAPAFEEEYSVSLARDSRSDKLARDPIGFTPARNVSMLAGEDDVKEFVPPDAIHVVRSPAPTGSSERSLRSVSRRADVTPKVIQSPKTSVLSVSSFENTLGDPMTRETKVIRKTIKKVKKPARVSDSDRVARLPADTKDKGNVVRKSITYLADGSCIEKIVNIYDTPTTIKRSTHGKGTGSSKATQSHSESIPTASCYWSTPTSQSPTCSASSTSSRTKTSGRSRTGSSTTEPSKSQGASVKTNVSARSKRAIKSRTTKQSSDGSRTEVTEYTDGSKVTKTFARRS